MQTARFPKLVQSALLKLTLLACFAVMVGGCTQGVGDIDRTQPDLLKKSDFDGKWFIRQSVVDVPPTSVASFEGEMGGMELVTWEIQQDLLVGYRAYELVPGTEERADSEAAQPNDQPVVEGEGEGRDPTVFKGNPIVAYVIMDHVDVKRSYNPQTGEQTNVIEENTSDRPWFEREYMRVNWAANVVENYLNPAVGTMNPFMMGSAVTTTSWIPANEGGPDAFVSERSEQGDVNYMDFTYRIFVSPSPMACWSYLMENSLGDCTGDEVKVRTSILKADDQREQDYIPEVYDDRRHGEFGYFRTERPTYNRQRGNTYTGLILLANRHDIWERSHASNGEVLSYEDRDLQPVVYTLSHDFPSEMRASAHEVADEWDHTLKKVAATLRGQTVPQVEAELETNYDQPCLFCLDENRDPEHYARNGDLRRNFLYWIDDPQRLGPLGYGPSAAHPETGRIVSAAAYVYGAGIDALSQSAKDIVDLLNGDLDETTVRDGDYVRQAVYSGLQKIDPRAAEHLLNLPREQLETELLGSKAVQRIAALQEQGLPPARPGFADNQLKRIQGTPIESMLLAPEEMEAFDPSHLLAAAAGPDANPDDPANLSVVNWGTPSKLSALSDLEKTIAAQPNCLWLKQFSDPTVIGLAREAKNSGLAGDELYQYLRKAIFKAVMLHEVGHTLGLRHNFAGSADPLNYQDEYWPLRETTLPTHTTTPGNDGSVEPWLLSNCSLQQSTDGTLDISAACSAQEDAKMSEYQYSTIMDYGSRFNSDIHGIGRYDEAAIASGYGDLVEVFDDEVTAPLSDAVRGGIRNANGAYSPVGGLIYLDDGSVVQGFKHQGLEYALNAHYTDLPAILGGVDNIAQRRWIPRSSYDPASITGPMKVPYLACYDEFADSVEDCHRWDHGADAYEITSNLIQRYKEYYVFTNFQRDRVGFSGVSVLNTVASRYLMPMTNMYQHWLFSTWWRSSGTPQGSLAQLAMREGFNTLWNVMSTPAYGSYENQGGEYVQVSEQLDQSDLNITPGVGRRQFSRFDYSSGYNVFRRVLESGHYYDQIAGLMALTTWDASVVGVGNDVQADVLRYSIPYYLVFEEQLNDLFGSLFRQNQQEYAFKVAAGNVVEKSIFTDPDATADGFVRTDMSWSTRILTLLYGMAFFSSNFDVSFVQRCQVGIVGSGEELTVGTGFERVEVNDPFSGRQYAAVQRTDGTDGPWFAAEYIGEVATMVTDYEAMADSDEKTDLGFDIQQRFEEIEIMRSLFDSLQFTF